MLSKLNIFILLVAAAISIAAFSIIVAGKRETFTKNILESYQNINYVIPKDTKFNKLSNESIRFNILVPFYNIPGILLEKCIESILSQDYKNYRVCLIDDASSKHADELYQIIDYYCLNNDNFVNIKKSINGGTLQSNVQALQLLQPDDNDVCIICDGDDELYGNDVLTYLANVYMMPNVNLTFGNYLLQYRNGKRKKARQINFNTNWYNIAESKLWRKMPYQATHLKTFRYKLFKHVDHDKYLKRDGEYVKSATDVATMLVLIEIAGQTFRVIERPLYLYNCDLETNHHGRGRGTGKQRKSARYLQSLEPMISIY